MNRDNKVSFKDIKTLTLLAMLIALSAVGALIKIYNTVAFDSLPGYFAALYLGGWYGALVISLGHMLTAVTSGFPLGLPIHLLIAVEMAVCAWLFKFFYKKFNKYIAVLVGTILNGPISILTMVPIFGWGFFAGWVLPLTIASFVNIFLAALLYEVIGSRFYKSR
ncbi:ECF transporter S component [Aceticella autotrophica]|uniref:ECF transporter S component n=1 Tax=Aceticella autotrophica TaxID=2755338 RepID=A0A975AX95_9THEO|nr:ECF transporter S component [Aceticella autotrophica]QSZ28078.1 ECF transporter S component [Aceticella autotrophica]